MCGLRKGITPYLLILIILCMKLFTFYVNLLIIYGCALCFSSNVHSSVLSFLFLGLQCDGSAEDTLCHGDLRAGEDSRVAAKSVSCPGPDLPWTGNKEQWNTEYLYSQFTSIRKCLILYLSVSIGCIKQGLHRNTEFRLWCSVCDCEGTVQFDEGSMFSTCFQK